ncbi:MAG: hypothetical protein U1E65_25965 [Myxococcota bacterium]
MRTLFVIACGWLCCGCVGGLENEPFLPGNGGISGTLEPPIDPAHAFVTVLDQAALTASVAADGRFLLAEVPRGKHTLAVSTGAGKAAVLEVEVFAARVIEAKVPLAAGAALDGRVFLEEAFDDHHPSRIEVAELPIALDSDAHGSFHLGALPEMCLSLSITHAGFAARTATLCPSGGETATLNARLRHATAHAADLCAPCASAAECHGGLCIRYGEESLCSSPCDGHTHLCPQGFACLEVSPGTSACVVSDRSCAALADFDQHLACQHDEACGLLGVSDGRCDPSGTCSLRCASDHDCPAGTHCVDGGSGLLCR